MDGAGWDKRNLRLCESINKVLYTVMPIVHVYAINSTDPKDPKLYLVSDVQFFWGYMSICRIHLFGRNSVYSIGWHVQLRTLSICQ